jgi:hypothetical protein
MAVKKSFYFKKTLLAISEYLDLITQCYVYFVAKVKDFSDKKTKQKKTHWPQSRPLSLT